jgi:hypothetical protein
MHFSCLEAAIQRAGNVSGHQAAVTGHRVFCACVAELFPGSDATRGHHALRVSVQRVEISKPRLDFSQSCARIARCRRHQISRDAICARPQVVRILVCSGHVVRDQITFESRGSSTGTVSVSVDVVMPFCRACIVDDPQSSAAVSAPMTSVLRRPGNSAWRGARSSLRRFAPSVRFRLRRSRNTFAQPSPAISVQVNCGDPKEIEAGTGQRHSLRDDCRKEDADDGRNGE